MRVREVALGRFGRANLVPGEPLAHLEEALIPVYFHHRYALEAAAKLLGGFEYRHALAGEAGVEATVASGERQRAALEALLQALAPAQLDLPDTLWALLLPRPPEEGGNRELLASRTEPAFDLLGAAEAAQEEVLGVVLQPERMARLVDFRRRDPNLPSLEEVLTALTDALFDARPLPARQVEIRRVGQAALVRRLVETARDPRLAHSVRFRIEEALGRLEERLDAPRDRAEEAHRAALLAEVRRHRERGVPPLEPASRGAELPPGPPIGAASPPTLAPCDWSDDR